MCLTFATSGKSGTMGGTAVGGTEYWCRAHFFVWLWNVLHLQLHFALVYRATVSLPSGQLCYLVSSFSWCEGCLRDPSVMSKAEVKPCLTSFGDIWQSKYRAALPASNAALSWEGRVQKPLLLQVGAHTARRMDKLCSSRGRGNAHTIQRSKIWSSRSNTSTFAC